MLKGSKGSSLVFIILILVVLVLAGGALLLLQKERSKNITLQGEIEEIRARQKVAEMKLSDSKNMIVDLEAKLRDAATQINNLSRDFDSEKSAKLEALAKMEQLRQDVEQQKSLRMDLENKLAMAQKDVNAMKTQLNNLEIKKAELETKVYDLEEKTKDVELGTIVVGPEAAQSMVTQDEGSSKTKQSKSAKSSKSKPGIEGKVLVVNKDYKFVVINLGSKDGVSVGDEFSVYHNNKYIGDVKVEKIQDSMAAAAYVSPALRNKVFEGDKVTQKAS